MPVSRKWPVKRWAVTTRSSSASICLQQLPVKVLERIGDVIPPVLNPIVPHVGTGDGELGPVANLDRGVA